MSSDDALQNDNSTRVASTSAGAIPIVPADISYAEARERFFRPNLPFIISGLAKSWPASRDWVASTHSLSSSPPLAPSLPSPSHATPRWEHLLEKYGDEHVSVVDCSHALTGYDSASPEEMSFKDVVQLWKDGRGRSLYIKDWHLPKSAREKSEERPFYEVPDVFKDDWMHHYYTTATDDDFGFVYFGTKGTVTPLHRDVYTSYSWSANVLGRKRWHFVRPEEIRHCRRFPENRRSELVSDLRNIDASRFPHFDKASVLTVEQEEGDIIFVPSNWYHFVENLSPFVISINHNWCNAHNLSSLYASMWEEVEDTARELEDVRAVLERRPDLADQAQREEEFTRLVQDVVRQNAGWDWTTFWKMVALNLDSPACSEALRPPREQVLSVVRPLIEDFKARTDHSFGPAPGQAAQVQSTSTSCHDRRTLGDSAIAMVLTAEIRQAFQGAMDAVAASSGH